MRNAFLIVAGAGTLALAGCSHLGIGNSRDAYVRDAMRNYRFPVACETLWADGLKMLAQDGFSLVGADRQVAGQEKQGFVTNFLNAGHATTRDDKGVYEAETDNDNSYLRYALKGTPAGKDGCFVNVIGIKTDKVNDSQSRHRDYEKELYLLSMVAPAEAARISEEADKAR